MKIYSMEAQLRKEEHHKSSKLHFIKKYEYPWKLILANETQIPSIYEQE